MSSQLIKRFLAGKPVELTEASKEVVELRKALEGDGLVGNVDVGGNTYWNDSRTVAVYVPSC